jgi:hypothetical protein
MNGAGDLRSTRFMQQRPTSRQFETRTHVEYLMWIRREIQPLLTLVQRSVFCLALLGSRGHRVALRSA